MKFTRNVKALSKLILILLLLLATIVGAILSYLWVIGYFINLGIAVPEKTTVSIANVTFDNQDTSHFFVTLFNPSYSPTEANITKMAASTGEGEYARIHNIEEIHPILPYSLLKGEEETFNCSWSWAKYTGETVRIIAFIADGSGPTFERETPLVDLEITDLSFDSAISVTHFNMTLQNSPSSITHVNVTEITVTTESLRLENITPSLPQRLDLGSSVQLKCLWDWTNYQNTNVTVAVHTLQGYMVNTSVVTPPTVTLEITKVEFTPVNTTYFNVTVRNNEVSPTHLNVTRITVTMETQIIQEWLVENGTEVDPNLPYSLDRNSSETFTCPWNWTERLDKNVTITIYTLQGFTAKFTQVTPAPIILEIAEIDFDPLNTTSFNVTVKNSEFSIADANITEITVILEGNISKKVNVTDPTLPKMLNRTQSIPFNCTWGWAEYSGKNATIVVNTQEGYSVDSSFLLKALTITDVIFNSLDMDHFVVTVQNPTGLNFNITTMNVTVEGGFPINITGYIVPSLPRMLTPDTDLTFMCEWGWASDQGKNVTITIETLEGYITFHTRKIPSV